MSSQLYFYDDIIKHILNGTVSPISDTLKCMLVTDAYTFDASHSIKADVCISPSPEVVAIASPDNGYVEGGKALTGVTLTEITSPVSWKVDFDDPTWLALTATFKWAVFYFEVTRNAVVNPLLGCAILDYEGETSIIVNGVDYMIQLSNDGLFVVSKAS